MEHLEPPTAPESSTTAQIEDVQPAHDPSFAPVPPYDGPLDKASVIQAIIDGRCTPREASGILDTSTGSIRKLVSRERARQQQPETSETTTESETRATSAKHARPQPSNVSRAVSPPIIDTEADAQSTDNQQFNPETPSETTDATGGPSGSLQPLQHAPRDTENGERDSLEVGETDQSETPSADRDTSKVATFHAGTANLLNTSLPKSRKVTARLKEDEGYFERDELDTLDNLHRIITRNAKRAESGKDCQGWTASLAIVLDLRRRAAGKACTLVKEQTAKASSVRNSIVFIGNSQQASEPTKPKVAKLQPAIDVESLNDHPPAITAAMDKAPDYVRSL